MPKGNKMLQIANHHISKRISILLLAEILILIASVYAGAKLRFYNSATSWIALFDHFFLSSFAFAIVIVFSMSAVGMYQLQFNDRLRAIVLRLMPAFALGFCIITIVFYLVPNLHF